MSMSALLRLWNDTGEDGLKGAQAVVARVRERLSAQPLIPSALPLEKVRFVVFDTETTGFFPGGGDEVIAIGAVVCQGGELLCDQCFHQLVNPGRPVPPVVQNLTGLTDELLRTEGIPFLKAMEDFLDFAGEGVLVGHGVDFDLSFLNHKLRRACRAALRHPAVDTRLMHQRLYPELESYSLDALLALYGLPGEGRHTALGDAFLTAEIFLRALPLLAERNHLTVRELRRYAPHGPHGLPRGPACI